MMRLVPWILLVALMAATPATAVAAHGHEVPGHDAAEVSYTVVMLVGNRSYEGVYISTEVLAESVDGWEDLPVVPGHENAGKRRFEVGRLTDVRMEGAALVATLRLDPDARAYPVVDRYIDARFSRGEAPEVSVGMSARTDGEGHAIELYGDHLAIVARGACGPIHAKLPTQVAAGCGILPPGVEEGLATNA